MLKNKYHITVSETPFRATTTTKPEGTFFITSTPIKSRIINKISDKAGRWAGNVLTLKNKKSCPDIHLSNSKIPKLRNYLD
jgi:hypothetical protein